MIKLTQYYPATLRYQTDHLLKRMLNPICGLTQEIGFVKRSKFGDRIIAAGAEITGVHHLLNKHDPGRGAYHTGGAGVTLNEAMIKSLGESIERYSQLIAEHHLSDRFIFATYNEMKAKHEHLLDQCYFSPYADNQYNTVFPFSPFDADKPLTWISVKSLIDYEVYSIPAQFLLVGYQIKQALGEPWYSTAVTTGTAAHTNLTEALLGALLELIQIDATMGHWYGDYPTHEIGFDERTIPIENLIKKYSHTSNIPIRFFWLMNADLPGITIACVLEKPSPSIPRISIGLGASTSLNDAMYKAYLEAVGVANLSSLLILNERCNLSKEMLNRDNDIYDIDRNVALYGEGRFHENILHKFNAKHRIMASDITADLKGSRDHIFAQLVKPFKETNKQLFFLDLANRESNALGIYVPRLWSPHLLSLCFPSAPPMNHPRFKYYGGFSHHAPHPYP